jgi:hypothetical protein
MSYKNAVVVLLGTYLTSRRPTGWREASHHAAAIVRGSILLFRMSRRALDVSLLGSLTKVGCGEGLGRGGG